MYRLRPTIRWTSLLAALPLVQVGCEFDPPPTPSAFVEVERLGDAAQPASPEFGVYLSVQSWGGASVWLEIAGGTLQNPDGDQASAVCLPMPGGGAFVDVFVAPDEVEAVLSAALYERSCPAGNATRPKGTALAFDTEIVTREVSNSTDSDSGGSTDDTETSSTT
jgi:hypothetical protein